MSEDEKIKVGSYPSVEDHAEYFSYLGIWSGSDEPCQLRVKPEGLDENGNIYLDIKTLSLKELMMLAPLEWWNKHFPQKNHEEKMAAVVDWLVWHYGEDV